MSYAILPPGRHPAIAIPLDHGLVILRATIGVFPAFTVKRKIFKRIALLCALLLWVLRRLGLVSGSPLGTLDAVCAERIREVCPGAVAVAPIWSQVPGRSRRYFRIFGADAQEIAFAKVTTSGPGCDRLITEARALRAYRQAVSFECPRVISLEEFNSAVMLVTTALPKGSRLRHAEDWALPAAIQREIAGASTSSLLGDLRGADWYQAGRELNVANTHFLALLDRLQNETTVQLCAVHGDFGSENFFVSPGGRIFLIDFEHFSDSAPAWTDAVGFWIGKHHRAIQAGKPETARRFQDAFPEAAEIELFLALLYLSAFDVKDAIKLVTLWKS